MPQRKKEVTRHEWHRLLLPEAFKFALGPDWKDLEIHKGVIDVLLRVAADPKVLTYGPPFPSAGGFARLMAQAPDFTIQMLAHLRGCWKKLEASKHGTAMITLARNPALPHPDNKRPHWVADWRAVGINNSGLSDKEIARTLGDDYADENVIKARKALLKRYEKIDSVLAQHVGKGGKIV